MTTDEREIPDAETVRAHTRWGIEQMTRFWPMNNSGFAGPVNWSMRPRDGFPCQLCHHERRRPWEPPRSVPPDVTSLETACADHGGPIVNTEPHRSEWQ